MSTAADPLGPGLSGPLPRTLPRRRQGVYVFGGISRGVAPCLSGGAVFSALKPIAGGAAFILGSHLDAAAG